MFKPLFQHKLKIAAILSLSFAASFMIFFFTPLDMYLHNPAAFVVGWGFLAPYLALFTLALFFTLIIFFAVLCIRKLWFVADLCLLLLFGLVIALYVQLLFLNGRMILPAMNLEMEIEISGAMLAANLLLFSIITALPVCIRLVFRARLKQLFFEKLIIFASLIFFGMQSVGLVSVGLGTELPPGVDRNQSFFSYAPMMELGDESNIIVFILDCADVLWIDSLLELHPELSGQLDGFTYYRNNVSGYNATFPSVTTMLTDHRYTLGTPFLDYWDEAWARHSFIDTLRESGYTVNLSLDHMSTFGDISQLADKTDNIVNIEGTRISLPGMARIISSISMLRLSPYVLKDIFAVNLPIDFGNHFLFFLTDGVQLPMIGPQTDFAFYEYIKHNPMAVEPGIRVVNIIHLNFSHPSNALRFVEDRNEIIQDFTLVESGDYLTPARAGFRILEIYFEHMKYSGIYDSSTIILIGDHGRPVPFNFYDAVPTTMLMVKPKNARGDLIVQNEAELTNFYFGASILEIAGIAHSGYGLSFFDIIEERVPPIPRDMFFFYRWWAETQLDIVDAVFEVSGDANDISNWKRIR